MSQNWMKTIWKWADKNAISEEVIPREASALLSLKSLVINKKLKKMPEAFENLQQLEKLDLKGTELSYFPQFICKLTNLNYLDLSSLECMRNPALPNNIDDLIHLETLILRNKLYENEDIPDSFYNLKNLVTLDLSENPCLEIYTEDFANFKKLKVLYLKETFFSDEEPDFSYFSGLTELYLDDNQLDYAYYLDELIHLEKLHLYFNRLRDCDFLEDLTQLKELDLGFNKLKEIPDVLQDLPKLEVLYLGDNYIKEIPDFINNLTALKILDLSDNQISKLPDDVSQLRKLDDLDIRFNEFPDVPATRSRLLGIPNLR